MRDQRTKFQEAMHRMRDAFLVIKDELEERDGFMSASEANAGFFDGYQEAKRLWGDLLLHRDILAVMPRDTSPAEPPAP